MCTNFRKVKVKGRNHLEDRWEDNSNMDLKEMGFECMYLSNLAQERVQWWLTCEESNEPSGSINATEFLDYLSIL
jgi:hypothetical protein